MKPAHSSGRGGFWNKPLARFLALVTLVWLLARVPLGLWTGDIDYVLTRVSRGSWQRQAYQGLLYFGLLTVFVDCWRRYRPKRPALGRYQHLLAAAGIGLVASLVTRALFLGLGVRDVLWQSFAFVELLIALFSALAVGLAEEAIFRGFLLGQLAQRWGWRTGALVSSALFASVHLFRPGTWYFKFSYGLGLFILGLILARVDWSVNSLAASAGLHSGIILLNLVDPWAGLDSSWWSGWEQEPLSGVLSWFLILGLWPPLRWWFSVSVNRIGGGQGPDVDYPPILWGNVYKPFVC